MILLLLSLPSWTKSGGVSELQSIRFRQALQRSFVIFPDIRSILFAEEQPGLNGNEKFAILATPV